MRERRKLRRFMKRIPARFRSPGLEGEGYIKNVSQGGLFLRTEHLPKAGEAVTVEFVDQSEHALAVSGTVRWTTDEYPDIDAPNGFGMLFDPNAEQSERFLAFFEGLLIG